MSRNPRDIQREEIVCALADADYNVARTARRIGMRPATLRTRLRLYGIQLRLVKPRAKKLPTARQQKILEYYEKLLGRKF